MNANKLLKPCVMLIGVAAAAAVLRAETHRFVPTMYYNMTSSDHAPVLHIKSGDKVVTATVDDLGAGADGSATSFGVE